MPGCVRGATRKGRPLVFTTIDTFCSTARRASAFWARCTDCSKGKQKFGYVTKKQLQTHSNNAHRVKRKRQPTPPPAAEDLVPSPASDCFQAPSSPDSFDEDTSHLMVEEVPESLNNTDDKCLVEVRDPSELGFSVGVCQKYFEQCYLEQSGNGGAAYLVKRSFIRDSTQDANQLAAIDMPSHHTELQINIAHLSFLLTRSQNALLASVMEGCYNIGCEDGYAHAQGHSSEDTTEVLKPGAIMKQAYQFSTSIPGTWTKLRRHHLEGTFAIVPNLPIPIVRRDIPEHSYVSMIDCIRDFLGHRDLTDIATIDDSLAESISDSVRHSSLSRRAQEIVKQSHELYGATGRTNKTIKSYIIIWSDDVEPNRTKSNRGSIWLFTATIATLLSNGHSMYHTYPIAVSKKNCDHEPVIRKLEEDMAKLRSGEAGLFYIGKRKQSAEIQFEVFAAIQDQPERRDFNCMRAGNGIHSARFGVSANHAAIYQSGHLASCGACLRMMEDRMDENQYELPFPRCNQCLNWDVLEDPNDLGLYIPPKTYPRWRINADNDWYRLSPCCRLVETETGIKLRPFKITYHSLKAAIDFAHDAFCNKGWSESECGSYLQVEGLDDKFIDNLMSHSSNCLSLTLAEMNPEQNREIINDAESNPTKYAKLDYPAPWVRPTISLDLHPDVIMHLLFLGVVKTIVQRIQKWLAAQLKWSSFIRSTRRLLDEFQTMTIDWLPILPFNDGKLGGWVSENFLGFSRIMAWFYQNIHEATEIADNDEPPANVSQTQWTLKQNKYWLRVRELHTEGNKRELSERVAQYLSQPNTPQVPTATFSFEQVEGVLVTLSKVLQCVMHPTVTSELVERTRYMVCIFLSKYDVFCEPLRLKNPPVLTSYNFICMLNLASAMEKFGPLRCLWEGGPRGEGFARFAKPFMKTGIRQQNWHYNLLTRLLRAKAFDNLLEKPTTPVADVNSPVALRDRKAKFYKYESAFTFKSLFALQERNEDKKPVSLILLHMNDGSVKLCGVVGDYESIMSVVLCENAPIWKLGMAYLCFKVSQEYPVQWITLSSTVDKIGFGVLLPLLEDTDLPGRFALISSNWETLSTPIATDLDALID